MLVIMNGNGTSRAGEPAGASRQRPAKSPRRILLVEDDGAIRRINAQVLVRSGYQVAAAQDGAAGWEALHANDFDLLITDHSMPGLSGLELVKKVRRARMTLPVIWPRDRCTRRSWSGTRGSRLPPPCSSLSTLNSCWKR